MSPEPDLPDGSSLADDLNALFLSGGKLPPKEPSEDEKLWALKKPWIQYFVNRHFEHDVMIGPLEKAASHVKTQLRIWQRDPSGVFESKPASDQQTTDVIRSISLSDVVVFAEEIVREGLAELANITSGPDIPPSTRLKWEIGVDFFGKVAEIAQAASELL